RQLPVYVLQREPLPSARGLLSIDVNTLMRQSGCSSPWSVEALSGTLNGSGAAQIAETLEFQRAECASNHPCVCDPMLQTEPPPPCWFCPGAPPPPPVAYVGPIGPPGIVWQLFPRRRLPFGRRPHPPGKIKRARHISTATGTATFGADFV